MIGIVYLIGTLGLLGVAKLVTGTRNIYDDSVSRERNKTSWNQTFFDSRGYWRDCITGCRVATRINEHGDEILFEIIGGDYSGKYKDLRNLSEIKRQMELKKNIEQAKKEGRTVAKKYDAYTAAWVKGFIHHVGEPKLDAVTRVPTYKECKVNKSLLFGNTIPGFIKADRYYDIKTGDEYVICYISARERKIPNENRKYWNDSWKIDDPNNETYFYMSVSTGHIIRRTDNQIINDKNETSNNCISIDSTNDFIERFNKMQDSRKEKIGIGKTFEFEYEEEKCRIFIGDIDCYVENKKVIKEKENIVL